MTGGVLTVRAITAAVVVLASQTGDAACEGASGVGFDCHVRTRGLQVESGIVVDVVTYWCDQEPQRQTFSAWIDARPGENREWEPAGRTAIQFIPAGPKRKQLRVEGGRCQPDVEYGTMWSSEGTSADGRTFYVSPDWHQFTRDDLC